MKKKGSFNFFRLRRRRSSKSAARVEVVHESESTRAAGDPRDALLLSRYSAKLIYDSCPFFLGVFEARGFWGRGAGAERPPFYL